ncbi:MAG: DNA helicase RecG, partial [Candidatus Omnitrophota bacterium]
MQPLKEISVQFIKGVGPSKKKLFEKLGFETIEGLLYFFPRRYEDRTRMTPLSQVKPGELLTVTGEVMARGSRQSWYARKHVYEVVLG